MADRSSLRTEIVGWAATLAFVAFSYALRRFLNRPQGMGLTAKRVGDAAR